MRKENEGETHLLDRQERVREWKGEEGGRREEGGGKKNKKVREHWGSDVKREQGE